MTLLGFFPTTLYRGAGRDSIPRQSVELHQTGTFRTLYRLSYSAAAICYKLGFAKAANLSIQFIVGCSRALKWGVCWRARYWEDRKRRNLSSQRESNSPPLEYKVTHNCFSTLANVSTSEHRVKMLFLVISSFVAHWLKARWRHQKTPSWLCTPFLNGSIHFRIKWH